MIAEVIEQRARWLRDLPARTALKVCNHEKVRGHLGRRYDAAIESHRQQMPVLGEFDQKIVEGLNRDGIFVTTLDQLGLPDAKSVVETATKLTDDFAAEAHERRAWRNVYLPDA